MRNPGKGRLLTFEPSSGNWRKNLGTDIRNGSVKRYPIIGIPFGLRPHSIPIMGNDTVNGILPNAPDSSGQSGLFFQTGKRDFSKIPSSLIVNILFAKLDIQQIINTGAIFVPVGSSQRLQYLIDRLI